MSLFAFPRLVQSEFAGAFRLLDELATVSRHSACVQAPRQAPRAFAPRFSYRENKDNYELKGELPGVDSKNVEIEFTDNSTLSIRGRTESRRESPATEAPATTVEAQPAQPAVAESETSSYHKASVEEDFEVVASAASTEATPTPSESVAAPETQQVAEAPKKEREYYYSERSVGQFARTFNFPRGTVDAENVKASLKDGILSIVVPKLAAPSTKHINIE